MATACLMAVPPSAAETLADAIRALGLTLSSEVLPNLDKRITSNPWGDAMMPTADPTHQPSVTLGSGPVVHVVGDEKLVRTLKDGVAGGSRASGR